MALNQLLEQIRARVMQSGNDNDADSGSCAGKGSVRGEVQINVSPIGNGHTKEFGSGVKRRAIGKPEVKFHDWVASVTLQFEQCRGHD